MLFLQQAVAMRSTRCPTDSMGELRRIWAKTVPYKDIPGGSKLLSFSYYNNLAGATDRGAMFVRKALVYLQTPG